MNTNHTKRSCSGIARAAMTDKLITHRLVELTFAPLAEVATWFTRQGMEVRQIEEGVLIVRNPQLNLTTALLNTSDPITRAICLGFAVAGVHWPHVFPDLPKAVDTAWRLRRKQRALSDQDPPSTGAPPGPPDNKRHPAQKRPPVTAPTFADLYKNRNPGVSQHRGSTLSQLNQSCPQRNERSERCLRRNS